MDVNAATAYAAAANTGAANTTTDVFPTAHAPLPFTAIDVFPIASAAAVSQAEERAAANILQCDGVVNAAADTHPRRCRCNPPPFLIELRGRKQSFRSSSPNIISSPTPSTLPSPLLQLDGCVNPLIQTLIPSLLQQPIKPLKLIPHHPLSATHQPKLSPSLPPSTHPLKHLIHVTAAKNCENSGTSTNASTLSPYANALIRPPYSESFHILDCPIFQISWDG